MMKPSSSTIRIVASDLDGTLLAPDHQLSQHTKETLLKLYQQGFHFVFATGRHHLDVTSIRNSVGIPAHMITSNGARVHDEGDQLMFSQNIEPSLIQHIIDLFKGDPSLLTHIYQDELWWINQGHEIFAEFHKDSGFSYQLFDLDNPPKENVAKLFFTARDHQHLEQYQTQLNQLFGDKVTTAFSTPHCLEVMAKGVSKGEALQAVARSLGYELDNCIAFGDGMNDVEMLSMAKHGKIMQTAHEKVKQALPTHEVIGSHENDAVANYLIEYLLK